MVRPTEPSLLQHEKMLFSVLPHVAGSPALGQCNQKAQYRLGSTRPFSLAERNLGHGGQQPEHKSVACYWSNKGKSDTALHL